jgi:hypothetical protein
MVKVAKVMDLMVRDAYHRYYTEAIFSSEGTKRNYTPKVSMFTKINSDLSIEELLSESAMKAFISRDNSPLMSIPALRHFYKFVYTSLFEKEDYPVFPINPESFREEVDEEKTVYLERDFDFLQLFDDSYYLHLNYDPLKITLKACLAIALGAAFDTQQLTELRLEDLEIQEEVRIRNPYPNYNSGWITINKVLSHYIRDYYSLRVNYREANTDLFFERIWNLHDARSISHCNEVWNDKKPSHITKQWVSYILKFICNELGYPRLETRHLKVNSILHYLYNTNGSEIEKIIRTFGWVSFVERACKYFYKEVALPEQSFRMEIINATIDQEGNDYFFPLPHRIIY